jgi:hypothetical protein
MSNPSYNAVMMRYNTGPRGPKVISKNTLSRLSDPAKGKFTSPSREAAKDAMLKQRQYDQEIDDFIATSLPEEKDPSFFLTEFDDDKNKMQKPKPNSYFRRRLDQV